MAELDEQQELSEAEQRMLINGTFGEDRWTLSLLLAKGLLSYRRRFMIFGRRKLQLTSRGRMLQRAIWRDLQAP